MPTTKSNISVVFSPAEFDLLPDQDLSDTTCVVFDVLRATTTMLAAFHNGARAIKPVSTIAEALQERQRDPDILLAGERNGVRIDSALTGGVDFDLGNSPREMVSEIVRDRDIATTTTNGTRAIRAAANAVDTLIASFGNLAATTERLAKASPARIIVVCSGTGENSCLEDSCGAGALVRRLMEGLERFELADSAIMAASIYDGVADNLLEGISRATNAGRLLSLPELAGDVEWSLRLDQFDMVPALDSDGFLRVFG